MIEIRVDTPLVECGETVRGLVTWSVEGDRPPRAVVVELGYRTEGRGDTDHGRAESIRHDAGAATSGEVPFELRVPDGGPITYDGRLIRVIWSVSASLDLQMARDEAGSAPVTVFPTGGHAVWAEMAPPPS